MITVARELKNKDKESLAKIYFFYGYQNSVFSKAFLDEVKYNNPINVLIQMGFEPVGDHTWVKNNK